MMRVAFCTAEFAPLAKSGGLADVASGLTTYLDSVGTDVRVFLPAYDTLMNSNDDARNAPIVEFCRDVPIQMGWRTIHFSLRAMPSPTGPFTIYLIDSAELFHRGSMYTQDGDEHVRWAFFARAILEACQRMGFSPDVFHCNDFHTALLPLYLRGPYAWDSLFAHSRSMLTIHNIAYQGVFGGYICDDLGLDEFWTMLHQEHLYQDQINFLESGLLHADMITTVSRTYAHEIRTPERGAGLDQLLQSRGADVTGIVNGVDYDTWDPRHDPNLPANYSPDDLSGKIVCRDALLHRLGLTPAGDDTMVFGIVSRLTWQKGFELLYDVMPELLKTHDIRLAALGSGDAHLEGFFGGLQEAFPGQVCFWRGYNNELAHLIEAGTDAFLMPSSFEPCGLNQMYSLRYGTPPIVRRTGGLADTVKPFDAQHESGTGFVFDHFDAGGLRWAMESALETFRDCEAWKRLQLRGMQEDFSWQRQGRDYLLTYAALCGV